MDKYISKRIILRYLLHHSIQHEDEPCTFREIEQYERTAQAADAGLPRPEAASWKIIKKARRRKAALRLGLDIHASRREIREAIRRRFIARYRLPEDRTLVQIGCALARAIGLDPQNTNWTDLRLEFLEFRALRFAQRQGLPPEDTLWAILKEGRVEWKWRAFHAEIFRRAIERQ